MLSVVAGSGSGNLELRINTPKKKIEIPLILGEYRSVVTACADVKAP